MSPDRGPRQGDARSVFTEATHAIVSCSDFLQSARAVFDSCKGHIGATAGYVVFLGTAGEEDEVVLLDVGDQSVIDPVLPAPLCELQDRVCSLKQARFQNRLETPHEDPDVATEQMDLQNALLAPLIVDDEVAGIMGFANKPDGFDDTDLDTVTSFGLMAAVALQNSVALRTAQDHLLRTREMLEAEHLRLRQYLDAAGALLVGVSMDGTVMVANKAICKMLGMDEADLLGREWPNEAFPGAWHARCREFMASLISGERDPHEYTEAPLLTPNGMRTIAWRHTMIRDGGGSTVGTMCSGEDITDRRENEERLLEITRRLELAVCAGGIGLWDWNSNTHELYFSPEWKAQLGYADHEIPNHIDELRNRLHPDDLGRAHARFTAYIDSPDEPYADEFRVRHKDGSYRWILSQANAITDSSGLLTRVIGTHLDLTDQKRSNEATEIVQSLHEYARTHSLVELLRETVDRTADLLESPIGFFHFVEDDEHTLVSQAWSTGTIERFCTTADAAEHYSIDDAGVWVDCVRERRAIVHNDYASLAHRKGLPDGHPDIVRELVVPVFREGKVVAILGVGNKCCDYSDEDVRLVTRIADLAWEVAERKRADDALVESEERFRLSLELSPEPIFLNQNGLFSYINRAGLKLLQADAAQLLGTPVMDRLHSDYRANAIKRISKLEKPGTIAPLLEVKFLRTDGSTVDVEATATMIQMPEGPAVEVALRDITARKLIEAEVKDHQERLAELARELLKSGERERRRVAVQLHDGVGQSLAAAKINAQRVAVDLKESVDSEAAEQLVVALESAITGVRSITSELSPPLLQAFGLGASLERLAEKFLRKYGLECDVQVAPEVNRLKNHAGTLLHRVATELLNNVQRHSGAQLARLRVEQHGEMVVLTVHDRGRGFDPSLLEHQNSPCDGFGLCSISEETQLVGGETVVHSEPGGGTRVEVKIPIDLDCA